MRSNRSILNILKKHKILNIDVRNIQRMVGKFKDIEVLCSAQI